MIEDPTTPLKENPRVRAFFNYATERENIRLRKFNHSRGATGHEDIPCWAVDEEQYVRAWTPDPILQKFRFCNVFREDDTVTVWFRENVRSKIKDHAKLIFACVAFRFFNTVKTGERMLEHNLFEDWCPERAREVLSDLKPLITAAYMVKTPVGVYPKLEGLIQILNPIWETKEELAHKISNAPLRSCPTLQRAHELLCEYPWVGPFMAYEAVTDLRHTSVLSHASDILTWANPGPGAMRGLSRIETGDVDIKLTRDSYLPIMQELLELSKLETFWRKEWRPWEMREVEHTLCEFDKYTRVLTGDGTPKQLYRLK